MASFYSSLSGEGDDNMLPNSYLFNQKLDSYQSSSELADHKVYTGQPCVSLPYPNLLPGSSQSGHGLESIGMHQLNITPHYSDRNTVHVSSSEPFSQYHGLSLSLGSQDLNQYANSNLCSLLSSQTNENLKNVQYLSFDLSGKNENTGFMPSIQQGPEISGTFCNSKYLKAAQEMLDELVNVRGAYKNSEKGFKGVDVKRDELNESINDVPRDISPSERQDLQNKVTNLLSMLDEVDKRYKQYCHQMQAVVSSFDMVAGHGSAQPYTALALKTISRQFRSLRDAIKKQIQETQKSLGEQDVVNSNGQGVLSRLRFVDQQLRQQKALQQFGIMRQPWRPQRGLPENAVSVLRAWLFEHFLHPYPKDSEKIVLARQTGLTRGQVANWFINARVRLWKPMIEEMYKEEFGDPETEPKSSPENAATYQELSTFDDRDEDYQGRLISAVESGAFLGNEVNFGLNHMQNKQYLDVAGNINFSDNNNNNNASSSSSPKKTRNQQVSLALGLQQSEKESQPLDGATSSSSMVIDKLEYYYSDPVNNQDRFGNSHMLSDFVA